MKTAMVWGADGGIGRAVVERLAAEGWTTVGIGRDAAALPHSTSHSLSADMANSFTVEQAVYNAALEVDSVDLWVYAVGDIAVEKVAEMSPDTWSRQISANLTGAYVAAHFSLPILAEDAHLVFVGAISERLQLPGFAAYAAAKAGLEAFAVAFGKEERKKRVTVLRPSAVNTSFWEKVPLRTPEDAAPPEKVAEKIIEAYRDGHKGQLDLVK